MKNRFVKCLVCLLLAAVLCANTAFAGTLTLPKNLKEIGVQAFYGDTSLSKVVVPSGTLQIQSKAFANSSLTELELPSTLTYIAADAFSGCGNISVTVPKNCYAYTRCVELGLIQETKYRALLVGNTYPGTNNYLQGPDNDVNAIKKMLSMQTDTPYDVTCKYNITATSIKNAITSTFSGADADDVSLFYYSGHGTSAGSLCGTGNTYISVSQLRSYLDTIPGKKIVLLDCCYSGKHIDKSKENVLGENFNNAVISAFSAESRASLATSNYFVMTACSGKQTSLSLGLTYSDGSEFWFGAFTYALTMGSGYHMVNAAPCTPYADYLGNNDGKTSLGEAYDDTVDTVERVLEIEQSTQYYGSRDFILWAK